MNNLLSLTIAAVLLISTAYGTQSRKHVKFYHHLDEAICRDQGQEIIPLDETYKDLEREVNNIYYEIAHGGNKEKNKKGKKGKSSFSLYDYDYEDCGDEEDEEGNKVNLIKHGLSDTTLYRCKDGTVTFEQPDSTGIGGWNGYCGETSVANIVYAYCAYIVSPKKFCTAYVNDWGPGNLPTTMLKGLKDIFADEDNECLKGDWKRTTFKAHESDDFIDFLFHEVRKKSVVKRKNQDGYIVGRAPASVLLAKGTDYFHWVTVMDVVKRDGKCHVVVNQDATQVNVPCDDFAAMAKNDSLANIRRFNVLSFDPK